MTYDIEAKGLKQTQAIVCLAARRPIQPETKQESSHRTPTRSPALCRLTRSHSKSSGRNVNALVGEELAGCKSVSTYGSYVINGKWRKHKNNTSPAIY